MNRLCRVLSKVFVLVITGLLIISSFNVKASAPYVTKTVNRYGEIVDTQGAYDPIQNNTSFEHDGIVDTFNKPLDLFIDSEDYFYICYKFNT